jgi:hypothetical protein
MTDDRFCLRDKVVADRSGAAAAKIAGDRAAAGHHALAVI